LATFVESYGGPLVLGSWDNQKISFIVNGAVNTTDAMTINTNGSVAFNGQAGSAGQVLQSNATSAPTWVTPNAGTVTSVSGTGTVSGLTLTGTVTSSGNLTLGGTLDLSSPPAIGGTTANTGRFTTVTSTVATGTAPFTVASTTAVANLSIGGNAATVTNGVYTTDTGTVTNTMLAGSIANAKLSNSAITFGSTSQALGSTVSGLSGVTVDNAAIGGTTPAAGTFTTLSLTGTTNQVSKVAVSSDPAAPSAGNLKEFAKTIAGGYTAPAFLNATNAVVQLQPAFANKRIAMFLPINSSGTTSSVGFPVLNVIVASSAVAVTTTNFFTRAVRLTYVSAATAGSINGQYNANTSLTLGVSGTPNFGGFYYVIRFGISDSVANPRTFVGLTSSTTAPTNIDPATLTNCIGVGQGSADTNLKIYYGGSAAQTPIDLGANFPTNTSSVDWYELTIFAPPTSANTVYYQVIRLNTGDKASGTLTGTAGTALPSNTTRLGIQHWRTNNATASATTLAIGNLYLETDY
jgi:hypothetical protein